FAVLPTAIQPSLPGAWDQEHPIASVLLVLSSSIGLPFLVVSATAPLLQRWFAETSHPSARDPYFLYAASNLGSMLALLSYPTISEPRLRGKGEGWLTQTGLWSVGYAVLAALTLACALALWLTGSGREVAEGDRPEDSHAPPAGEEASRLRWIALAFVPSS